MASVRQLARELGVSVATVSRALNNHPDVAAETRARVLAAAEANGYAPRLRRTPSNVVALVYPHHPVEEEIGSFESAMLSGIRRGVSEQRFDITIIDLERDRAPGETLTQFFHRKCVRGVLVRETSQRPEIAEQIAQEGFPCVLIASRSDDPRVNSICGDSRADSARAIEYLVQLGHTRIAIGLHRVLDSDHRDRLEGYREGLARHGIAVDERLVCQNPGTMAGGVSTLRQLLALPDPPTAIYFTTPPATVGALQECLTLGIGVPRELSIIGFDDADTRSCTFPHYTAVCQDACQLGLEAARWLTRHLEGVAEAPFRVRKPTTFVINSSTGLCPSEPPRLVPHSDIPARPAAVVPEPAHEPTGPLPQPRTD